MRAQPVVLVRRPRGGRSSGLWRTGEASQARSRTCRIWKFRAASPSSRLC